ncbi:MAG: ATP-binding protein [Chitinophagales bacterium]|nr:ATP-binding protein [Chitinophagales bacterium]
MKYPSPREVVLIASGSIASFTLIVLMGIKIVFSVPLDWYFVVFIPVANFVLCFFLFGYFVERFIYRKIKLIYKTIHDLKAPKTALSTHVDMDKNIVNQVEQEVRDWAANKAKEVEELKRTEMYRKEFLGNVSHELKTPIFNIQGYLHTLIDGGLYDEKINQSYLYKASKNLDRLTAIVEDLETISQLETNNMMLEFRKFDIIKLIREVLESLEMQAETKDIKLKIKEGTDKSVSVMADRERIRQVVTNLVTNSIKYGKQGGKTTIGVYDMHDNILVEVTDNGIGISKEHLPRLFERFYRVDKSRSRDQGGTGLGLAIVKHIIEAHHQTINVRSTVEMGSTFGFTLKKA